MSDLEGDNGAPAAPDEPRDDAKAHTNGKPKPRHSLPPGGNGAARPSEVQLAQRVDQVYSLLMYGVSTSDIYRTVTDTAKTEATTRAAALVRRATLSEAGDVQGAAAVAIPPNVWGDSGKAPHDRTIDRYIRDAKLRFKAEAAERAKEGDLVIGLQQRRLAYIFSQATSGRTKSLMVALAAVQEINKLHGLHGAVKLELSGPHGAPMQTEDVTKSTLTRAQAAAELRALLELGAQVVGLDLTSSTNGHGAELPAISARSGEELSSEREAEDEEL